MALRVKAAAIISGILAIYHQDIAIVADEALRSEIMSHIPAIPFLLAYLLYLSSRLNHSRLRNLEVHDANTTPKTDTHSRTGNSYMEATHDRLTV